MSGVLFGTHGGPGADGAARVASLLARRLGVPLTTLVVEEPMPVADYGYGITYVPTPTDDEAIRQALLESAQAQLTRCGATDRNPQVRTGIIVAEIAAAARAMGADLIVTGLGPHDLAYRALGGETALRLAQTATTPVLAVPAGATTIPRRVVAAVDFSPTSRRAAEIGARWLKAGDEMHLVYVAGKPDQRTADAALAGAPKVAEQLALLGGQLGAAPNVHMEQMALGGNPARALLDYAKRVDADLITLGTHGYGALKRLLLGSVALKIIRLATCAVLVAPKADPAEGGA